MATLATEAVSKSGLNATYAAANAGGDSFTPDRSTFLHVKNGDAASKTVTIATPATMAGLAIDDVAVTIPAGEDRFIGPFPPDLFADTDGLADITYSAVTSVTVAVIRV